jgi:hypothetical protein
VSGDKVRDSIIKTQGVVMQLKKEGFFLAREQIVRPQTV